VRKRPPKVICPYCGQAAELVSSATIYGGRDFGMMWDCRPCDAYVGTHKNSADHAPLGTLANAELRAARMRAHRAFDPLWKGGTLTRKEAYAEMRRILNVTRAGAHVARLDLAQCEALVAGLSKATA
jgi:hypothetical protein